ncbi:MAG TPA: alanine/glycine:cation symporter family protein [Parvularculaceae bacterium]|nr:alanine:cation symporter family protein [Amphiplicatus sp.]MCB9955070.1 alanine:cation symporter family protein [Caulobacterales bacterium]HOP20253.1 alanine/glycine:cation symporter family protein [Amphiplicatus sp.]HPE31953.1 alanine/glycine:cation symporter family protein [Parvularculaceae bacterium]HRX40233.1 alanine/glycine:cation symporter family protein [Parvularculaceae bacterium]
MDSSQSTSLADAIDRALTPFSDFISSIIFFSVPIGGVSLPLVVVWLISAAAILTVSFKFINLRGFRHAWSLVFRKQEEHTGHGEISHFQALSSALSGTVGLGNIASVPVAIALGGPGAVFWMILAGFLGMTSKFAECALAVKYRTVTPEGRTIGGPMYYIESAFARHGLKWVGKGAAIFFAVMAMGASISLFQVNQSYAQLANVLHITDPNAPVIYGVVLSSLVAIVILGGIRRIGSVTGVLVPLMGAIYMGAGLIIIAMNIEHLPQAIASIFEGAFGLDAAGGGLVGALINGIRRATYSNEAGVGSAAIAHSAVKTSEPLTEGYVALLEPFIDTIVVCSVTALVVIITGAYEPFLFNADVRGIEITSAAFASAFSWFPYVLLVASMLFAFTTLVSWSFYGAQAAAYLFGTSKRVDVTFKLILCVILSTGAAVSVSSILNFIDSMLFGMCIPNIIALYILLPELKRDVRSYQTKYLTSPRRQPAALG